MSEKNDQGLSPKSAVLLVALVVVLLSLAAPANAQLSSGSILGTASDATGAVIPGVSVKVTNTGTGLARDAVTNESGNYRVDLLPPGKYQVEAELPGFRKETRTGISVDVDQRARIDFTMSVGDVDQVINVEGQAPLVQADDSSLGQVIEQRKIAELPINGREFSQLAYIAPGAYAPRPNSQLSYRGGFEITGALESTNQYILDGINNNANRTDEISARINVDAIQEFKIQTSNYQAQYGRYAGGQVDAITKSGTNEIHGSAFAFTRNSALDVRNDFDPYPLDKLPPYRRHQYGGVIGGPIKKNQSFFFFGYQGQAQLLTNTINSNVPLPEFFSGDLSKLPGTIKDPVTGQLFQGNIIPKNRLDSIALKFQQFWPLPSKPGLVQNETINLQDPDNFNQLNAKIDHQLTGAQHLSYALTWYHENLLEWYSKPTPTLPGFQMQSKVYAWNSALAHVFTLSSTVINEFRVGAAHLYRYRNTQDEDRAVDWNAKLGIPGTLASQLPEAQGVPYMSVNNYVGVGNPSNALQPRGETNFNLIDNVSIQHGNHAFKLGIDFLRMLLDEQFTSIGSRGVFTFDGSRTGNSISDFLLGLPSISQRSPTLGGAGVDEHPRKNSFDAFLQDDWKVSPKLTFNLGLRYEANFAETDRYGKIAKFDPTLGNGKGGILFVPHHERYQPAIDELQALYPNLIIATSTSNFVNSDVNKFAPRFGFAFNPSGSSDTAIRGGFGVFFQTAILERTSNLSSTAPPFVLQQRCTTTDGITLENPWCTSAGHTLVVNGQDQFEKSPYYQNWNLDIQRSLPGNVVLDVAYQGKKGTKLIRTRDINQPLDRTTGIRPYNIFSAISYRESSGNLSYNGLQLRVERRSDQGLTYLFKYIWSKQLDDLGNPQDSYNQAAERSRSQEDARHKLSLSLVDTLPFGHGKRFMSNAPAIIDHVFGGWGLSMIAKANSGYPFTPGLSINNSGTGDNRDRPNLVGNPDLGSGATALAFWNRNAFVQPPKGQFGNAGRNTLTGPGFWAVDLAALKAFTPAESQRIEFRFEVFNVLNHPNFDDPATNWNSTAFGQVPDAFASRQMQLGLKWNF